MCIKGIIFVIILQLTVIRMYRHTKPLTEKIWSERCVKKSMVLNDCNWCRCNSKQKYDCAARVCEEIDMFGHFKDAIREIEVGMEGHGAWRSKSESCAPGVHYRRGAILCVCDEDGNWPNPVCRDLFRILHIVEITGQTRLSKNESCEPTKLYLVGCDVCICPSSGRIDPKLCTNKECQEGDPVLEADNVKEAPPESVNDADEFLEIYARCDPKYKYEIDCRVCDCLQNNRLLCDNCSRTDNQHSNPLEERSRPKRRKTICDGKVPLKIFNIACNLCHCSKELNLYCTVKKCFSRTQKLESSFKVKTDETHLKRVTEPPDDESCTPGTRFKRGCNYCTCKSVNGVKYIQCTRTRCSKNLIDEQNSDCVKGTFYEESCMLCHCYVKNEIKYRICRRNEECLKDGDGETLNYRELEDVYSLRGYCEPMHKYKRGCNTCRCLTDGRTVECTSKVCTQRSSDAVTVDVVPVEVGYGEGCPRGQSFRLDCNLCFCLSNGNAICTTAICSNRNA